MKHDPRTDPEVPRGMSIALLQDLHLLTRDGHLNADARRKLKQIRHLVGLLRPALDDAMARAADPLIVDCGAGKSYLGALLYELVLEAHGYKTTVTELVGWEHSAKNELILGKRVNRFDNAARGRLREVLARFQIQPALVRDLAARGLDPTAASP